MRIFCLGAIAPAAFVAATPAHVRATRVDPPKHSVSRLSCGIQCISARTAPVRSAVNRYAFRLGFIGAPLGAVLR